jgi:hypothetical protein
MKINALGQRGPQSDDGAGDSAALRAPQTYGWTFRAGLAAQLLQSGHAFSGAAQPTPAQPPDGMRDAVIASIIDIVSRHDLDAPLQMLDAQRISCVHRDGASAVHAQQIAAGICILAQRLGRHVGGFPGAGGGEQIARQKTPASRSLGNPDLGTIGDGDHNSPGVHTQPGPAGLRVNTRHDRDGAGQKAGRFTPASVRLLAIGADDHRGIVDDLEAQGQQAHDVDPPRYDDAPYNKGIMPACHERTTI